MWRRFSGPTDDEDEGGEEPSHEAPAKSKKKEEEDPTADLLVMLLALFVAGGVAMTVMPAAAAAEEPGAISSVSGGLTPDQAAELAVNASASLKALKAQEAAAEFTVKVAQLAYAPQVDVTANAFKLSEIEVAKSDLLSVGIIGADAGLITSLDGKALVAYSSAYQPLAHAMTLKATMVVPITDYLTRIRLYVAQAVSTQELSAQETAAARARIAFGARAAYWQWVAAQAQRKVAASGLELAKAFKQVAERRVAAESAPQVDIVTADARIAAAEMQVVQSEAMVSIATDALRILIGDDARELSIGQLPATAAGEEPEATEAMLARAYMQRPEFKALEAAIEVQRKGVTLAGLGLFPRLDLLGDLTHANPNQRAFPPKDAFNTTWAMGVQVSWSPNSAAASDPLEQRAAAQLSVLEAKRETLRNEIRTSVVTARSHVLESEGALRATKAGLAAMTEANRLRAAAYAAGRATSLEVLDAQSQLISSQIQSWLAATRYEMAVEELRFAVGDAR
jgi:outer membrane protein TolC